MDAVDRMLDAEDRTLHYTITSRDGEVYVSGEIHKDDRGWVWANDNEGELHNGGQVDIGEMVDDAQRWLNAKVDA